MTHFRLIPALLLLMLVLAACPSPSTPVPSPSPAATVTVTAPPITPAVTPTATAAPRQPTPITPPAGWAEHRAADFALWLPEAWTVLDPGADDLVARFAEFQAQNPLLAGIIGSAEALQDVALWAFGPVVPDSVFVDNLNVRRTSLGGQPAPDMAVLVEPIVGQYRELGFADLATQTDLQVGGRAAAYIAYSFPYAGRDGAPGRVAGHQYYVATDTDLWILTYAAGPDADAGAAELFSQSARSFAVR
jgi:hypothetical protein